MSKVSVFDHGWIDLVFEGRNHEYGAYQLRKQDSKTTILAFFTGLGIMALMVGIPVAISQFAKTDIPSVVPELPAFGDEIVYIDNSPKVEPITEQEPAAAAAPKSTATTAFTTPVATSEPVNTAAPTTQDFTNTDPGAITTAGNPTGNPLGTPNNPTTGTGEGTGTAPAGNGLATTATVDVVPAFPGGMEAFYEQVSRRFRTPEMDTAKTLKVYVSFVVETDGSMTNIKVGRDPGYGLANEAIRVLKSIKTKWTPGQIKGQAVRTAYNLPITVNIK